MHAPLRLIIADDHMLFRQGLKSMLVNLHANVSVVGEVERVDDIAPLLARTPCDVLLLDLQMDRSALADIPIFARRLRVARDVARALEHDLERVLEEPERAGEPRLDGEARARISRCR